jgi:hypothetical protein
MGQKSANLDENFVETLQSKVKVMKNYHYGAFSRKDGNFFKVTFFNLGGVPV